MGESIAWCLKAWIQQSVRPEFESQLPLPDLGPAYTKRLLVSVSLLHQGTQGFK